MPACTGAEIRLEQVSITLGGHHLLLRGVPRNPGLAIHAVLDKASANLTLARLQLLRLDAMVSRNGGRASVRQPRIDGRRG